MDFKETFVKLAEGLLPENDWLAWFDQNKETVEENCGRTEFLRIKPSSNCSAVSNAYKAQTSIVFWLKSQNIEIKYSERYKIGYEKELVVFCKEEKQRRKQRQIEFERKFGFVKTAYPKFYKQFTKSCSDTDILKEGKSIKAIEGKEKELSISFPEELKVFFQNISVLKAEGINIDFEEMNMKCIEGRLFLELGEFWYHGDGDLLLIEKSTNHVFAYAHEYAQCKIIRLAGSFTDIIEKVFVKYLKNYEE